MARDSGLIFAEQPRRRRWPLFVLAAGLVLLIAALPRLAVLLPAGVQRVDAALAARALELRLNTLQELYPLRAAALYLRTLIFALASLFEEDRLHSLDGTTLRLSSTVSTVRTPLSTAAALPALILR